MSAKKPLFSGPGLKKEGVVTLQIFFIALLAGLEIWIRSGAGIVSGLVLCLVTYGGIAFGRNGKIGRAHV